MCLPLRRRAETPEEIRVYANAFYYQGALVGREFYDTNSMETKR